MWLLHKGDWSVYLEGSPSSNCYWHLGYTSFLEVWGSKNNPFRSSPRIHVWSNTWTLLLAGNKTEKDMAIPSLVIRTGWVIQSHFDWYIIEVLWQENGWLWQELAISHVCLSCNVGWEHFTLPKFINAWMGNYTFNRLHVSPNWLPSLPVSSWICWMDLTSHAGQLRANQEEPHTAAERQNRYYDECTKGRYFQEGEWILWFYSPNLRNTLHSPNIGPYKVLRTLGEVTDILQLKPSSHPVAIHVDHLELFQTDDTPFAWRTTNKNDKEREHDDLIGDTSGIREEYISHPEEKSLETDDEEQQSKTLVEPNIETATPRNEDDHPDICQSRKTCQLPRPCYLSDYDLD